MAAPAPVEVRTHGSVASLVRREIEYFRRMEAAFVGHVSCHAKKSSSKVAAACSGGSPATTVKKPVKRKAGATRGGALLWPRMCSSAEVLEAGTSSGPKERPARVPYRHLEREEDEDDYSPPQE